MDTNGVIDEIRSRLDIVDVISDYVPLKKAGRNHKGVCPFHSEKTPSFMVSPEKQIFHCFGCGAGGDVFSFVMRHENLQFREALEVLAKRAGVELRSRSPQERGVRDKLKSVQAEALGFWKERLSKDRGAREYLRKRGVTEESVQAFSIGYAPPGWHTMLNRLKARGYSEEHIIKAGLAAAGQKGPYDVFRARIIFPIFDIHDEPVAFGGRVMDDSMPKYLNSPDTVLFKKGETLYAFGKAKEAIREKGYAVVVEGYLDVIMCHQYGLRNAVAPLGTALTGGQLKKLSTLTQNVLLVFDGDPAGIAAAKRSLSLILEQGLRGKVLTLPPGEDPDSILRSQGAEAMQKLMAGAKTPVGFLLKGADAEDLDAKKEAVEVIGKVSDPLLRAEFVRELSDCTGTDERSIWEAVKLAKKPAAYKGGDGPAKGPKPYDEEVLLLSAALAMPEKIEEIFKRIELAEIKDLLVREILGRLAGGGYDSGSIMDVASTDEERALVTRLSLNPGFEMDDIDRNIEDCTKRIAMRRVEDELQRLNAELKKAEALKDLNLQMKILKQRQKLMQEAG